MQLVLAKGIRGRLGEERVMSLYEEKTEPAQWVDRYDSSAYNLHKNVCELNSWQTLCPSTLKKRIRIVRLLGPYFDAMKHTLYFCM